MQSFRINLDVMRLIREHAQRTGFRNEAIRILDWGCGRGRSVIRLREEGYQAFGIDIDRPTLHNGHALFRARGLDPEQLLKHIDDCPAFPDASFDVIFSETTLEHVADLGAVARESFRMLRPGGIAIHAFPGSRWLIEPHVHMPLVHWLPPGWWRRTFIRSCLLFGFGPHPPWQEGHHDGHEYDWSRYNRYLTEKTHYRPRADIMTIFNAAGFDSRWMDIKPGGWRRLLPAALRDNGFPDGSLLLHLVRPA